MKDRYEDFKTQGKYSMKKYLEGFDPDPQEVTNAINKIIKALENSVKDFKEVGENAAQGFINGIEKMLGESYKMGRKLGTQAVKGAKKGLDEKSPSKEMGKVGRFGGLGFLIEFGKFISKAYDKGVLLGESVTDGCENGIGSLNAVITDEMIKNPTITPIINTSFVKNGLSNIQSMFNKAISTNVAFAGGINVDAINAQNSQSRIIDELQRMKSQMENKSGDSYIINGINYSESSDVSEAMKTIIRVSNIKRRV